MQLDNLQRRAKHHAVDVDAAKPSAAELLQRSLDRRKGVSITRKQAIAVILVTLALYVYRRLLLDHGTFAPPFIWWYMANYYGPPNYPESSLADFKPSLRVVFTFSTLPSHVENLNETITSLLQQSVPPDAIHVNIPDGTNKRTGRKYYVPEYLTKIDKVQVNRGKDYGPLTKLYPALEAEKDPDTIIITVDDDKVYPPNMLKTLMWYVENDPRYAFGVCGWSFMWWSEPYGVLPVYAPLSFLRGQGKFVDVLQACCGNAYRRKFFPDLSKLAEPPTDCYTTDDIWIAGYLATHSNIRKVIVPENPIPTNAQWKAKEDKSTRLSTFNSANLQDIKCIRGVEQRFGKAWPTANSFGTSEKSSLAH